MRIVECVADLRNWADHVRRQGRAVGFVPTMGYLHDGHLSLVRRARQENDAVVVSVFVNPTQFGPDEDFGTYPRDPERDARLLREEGVEVLFLPTREEMYPQGFCTHVEVEGLSGIMCGRHRPGHFRGVATVVAKLFSMVGECRAYFGEKDYQQLVIVRRMVADLDMPVEVVGCPTVREPDGLAMSSRNTYLTAEERAAAPVLYRALTAAREAVEAGETDAAVVRGAAARSLSAEPLFEPEYVEVRDAETLASVKRIEKPVVIALAGQLGRARLIDNVVARPRGVSGVPASSQP